MLNRAILFAAFCIFSPKIHAQQLAERWAKLEASVSVEDKIRAYYQIGLLTSEQQEAVNLMLERYSRETEARVIDAAVTALAKFNFQSHRITQSPAFDAWTSTIIAATDPVAPKLYASPAAVGLLQPTLAIQPVAKYWTETAAQDVDVGLKLVFLFENYGFGYARPKAFDASITKPLTEKVDAWFAVDPDKREAKVQLLARINSIVRTPEVTRFVLDNLEEKPELFGYLSAKRGELLAQSDLRRILQWISLNEGKAKDVDASQVSDLLGRHCAYDDLLKEYFRSTFDLEPAKVSDRSRNIWAGTIGNCQNHSWGQEFYQLLMSGENTFANLQYSGEVTDSYEKQAYTGELLRALLAFVRTLPIEKSARVKVIFDATLGVFPDIHREAVAFLLEKIDGPGLTFDTYFELMRALGDGSYFEGAKGQHNLESLLKKLPGDENRAKRAVIGAIARRLQYSVKVSADDLTSLQPAQAFALPKSYWQALASSEFDPGNSQHQTFLQKIRGHALGQIVEVGRLSEELLDFLKKINSLTSDDKQRILAAVRGKIATNTSLYNQTWLGKWLASEFGSVEVQGLYFELKTKALSQPAVSEGSSAGDSFSNMVLMMGLVHQSGPLALDLLATCMDPVHEKFADLCGQESESVPLSSADLAFYRKVVDLQFNHPDPFVRLWTSQLATLGMDAQPRLRDAIGKLWLAQKQRHFAASEVQKLACGLTNPGADWFSERHFTEENTLGSNPMTLQGAATSMQLLFLVRAASRCPEVAEIPDQVRKLLKGEEVGGSGQGLPELAMRRVRQLLESTHWIIEQNRGRAYGPQANPGAYSTEMPYSTFDQYALQFYVTLVQDLKISPSELSHPDYYKDALAIQTYMMRSLHGFSREGSFITTYAYATAILNVDYPEEDLLLHLHSIAKEIRSNAMAVPYAPTKYMLSTDPRDAIGRAAIFYLALHQNQKLLDRRDPGHGRDYRALLLDSLRIWHEHAYDLVLNSFRAGYHLGVNHLGSHYFYPCLPYVAQAIRVLQEQKAQLKVEDRIFLESFTQQFKQILADVMGSNGQAYPWGGSTSASLSWRDGPAYAGALVGMAMLEVAPY